MSISKALLVTAALCVVACDDPETAARADINSETPPYGNLSPLTVFSDDIGDVCTGFNFEAFGVE